MILLFMISKRLFTPRAALVAAAALAFNLSIARRAPLTGNESLKVFMALLFFLFLLMWLRSPSFWKGTLCGLLLSLAASVNYNAMIMIVPLARWPPMMNV